MRHVIETSTAGGSPLRARVSVDQGRRVCQVCGGVDLIAGLDLGHQPAADLLAPEELRGPETLYPMQLFLCADCGLCQLGYVVDPEIVWRGFSFISGTTRTATQHLQGLAGELVSRLGLDDQSFAVDIGSNDGTLLAGYAEAGVGVLGVDPAELPIRAAIERGIPTWHAYFDEQTAERIVDEHGQADAISAAGCFAHIADLAGVMKGLQVLLKHSGIFCSDNQYWLDVFRRRHYDNVYHQHLRNYSLKPLVRLFADYGMEVFDVQRSEVYGGSIRVFAGWQGDWEVSPRVSELLELEHEAGLYDPAKFESFAVTVGEQRDRLFDVVYQHRSAGRKVVGIGAAAKAATVCNYCRLDRDLIAYITDVNRLRVGKHLAGAHIPVVDEQWMFDDPEPADAGILFAWNYRHEIEPKLRQRGWRGELIEP
jgi:SAM-dependent methyltransferase